MHQALRGFECAHHLAHTGIPNHILPQVQVDEVAVLVEDVFEGAGSVDSDSELRNSKEQYFAKEEFAIDTAPTTILLEAEFLMGQTV